jgi:uncharacterized protein (DUF3820 family)
MSSNNTIVPFGKYKGRSVEELLVDDPSYLQWLSSQDWFRAKYITLHQTIINRGAEPEENALQVLFLDDDFCLRFLRQLTDFDQRAAGSRKRERNILEGALKQGHWNNYSWQPFTPELRAKIEQAASALCTGIGIERRITREFEVQGVDVKLILSETYAIPDLYEQKLAGPFSIEIKPIVGDDYPAVLRQMRANQSTVLFLEQYTGQGATRDQFIKTFQSAEMRVIFRDTMALPP